MSASAERPVEVTVVSDAEAIWGSELSVLNLLPRLQSRGIRLTVAGPPGPFARSALDFGARHVPLLLPPRGGPRTDRFTGLLADARRVPVGVARIARATGGGDVVHSNSLLLHPDTVLAGRLTRRPTVIELHDIVGPGPSQLVLSAAVALSSAAISISRATTASVRGPGRRRIRLVPQGVDVDRFRPGVVDADRRAELQRPNGGLLVGVVGRIDPAKGIDIVIRAAARASAAIDVVVVGATGNDDGRYLEEIRRLGRSLLGDRFRYAGRTEDVPETLRSLDVLVNASAAEPFGLSVLEAQACGIAVVGTDSGGIPDFVADDVNGLLVPPGQPAALAAALDRLAGAPELRNRLAERGLDSSRTRFSLDARADTLAALYRRLARGRSDPVSPR